MRNKPGNPRKNPRKNPLKPMKLFPRNLTARADAVVLGNPVTSRPESAVENCWPGLEFDQRNLDKAFLAGLVLEYHDERATIVREVDPKGPAGKFLSARDIEKGVYVAFVQGNMLERNADTKPKQQVFSFVPPAALENWRVVRDFEPGPVAIALCDKTVYDLVLANFYPIDAIAELFRRRVDRREGDFLLLFGTRAHYLTEDGVIDPALIPPGNLTRSMCSPWQYDFTDCGCFFWASNKPDMVSSADQPLQILNFQRKDRSKDAARQPTDWLLKDQGGWDDVNMRGHVDIINHFDDLKFVIAGREMDDYAPSTLKPSSQRLLSRREIIERLNVLATVEHALCVEYLYAYYSLKLSPRSVPRREPWQEPLRPTRESATDARIFTAADETLRVAIDEMRHFRWVNEMLIEFEQPWVLGRAKVIGIDFPGQEGFKEPFRLVPLTARQLDWFIKVEKASPHHEDPGTLDGMYTLILRSIELGADFARDKDERDRLAQFVQMIIAEGNDHFHRFTRVKAALDGLPESAYLRVTAGPKQAAAGSPERMLQDTADASYAVLLHAFDFVFRQRKDQRGELLEAARRGMYNIDAACRQLSERHVGAPFTLPDLPPAEPTPALRKRGAESVGDPLRPQLQRLRQSGHADLAMLADRMDSMLSELTSTLDAAKTA